MLACELPGDPASWKKQETQVSGVKHREGCVFCPALELADVKGGSSDQLSALSILMSGQGRERNGLDDPGCQTPLLPKKPLH